MCLTPVNGGKDPIIEYVPAKDVSLGALRRACELSFEYTRPALIFTSLDYRDVKALARLPSNKGVDPDPSFQVMDDQVLLGLIEAWETSAGQRRKAMVNSLFSSAVDKVGSENPSERLLGLDQIFEMISLPANHSSVTDSLLGLVVSVLGNEHEFMSIRNKAALICWYFLQVATA